MNLKFDIIIIGSGAAGMMSAAVAGRRGRRVLVLDHAKNVGEKIRISGGGRCNFTNLDTSSGNFFSTNVHFAKSALGRYQPSDFIDLLDQNNITWFEKTRGQLFCEGPARQIVDLLLSEMRKAQVVLRQGVTVQSIERTATGFTVSSGSEAFECENLIVACGGKSIPKIGATGFGYEIAKQFGHKIIETAPALVPLTFSNTDLIRFKELAGVAVPVQISCNGTQFSEDMLFTHRGLSGPAILQISTFWRLGDTLKIHLLPDIDLKAQLLTEKQSAGRKAIHTFLAQFLPKRLALDIADRSGLSGNIADLGADKIDKLISYIEDWQVIPTGSEGYRTAEVTRGGVDTDGINARTMESKSVPGLYFVGEVIDVTGWLGGYNFQWAWASGHAAGGVA